MHLPQQSSTRELPSARRAGAGSEFADFAPSSTGAGTTSGFGGGRGGGGGGAGTGAGRGWAHNREGCGGDCGCGCGGGGGGGLGTTWSDRFSAGCASGPRAAEAGGPGFGSPATGSGATRTHSWWFVEKESARLHSGGSDGKPFLQQALPGPHQGQLPDEPDAPHLPQQSSPLCSNSSNTHSWWLLVKLMALRHSAGSLPKSFLQQAFPMPHQLQ
mmetsp:Transcript_61220/g.155503  ORF Transcript_61220/g.155503 Transcript_61220/m.155503 type:complete len:215 (+) Transcript_61220:572-1216(+)